LADPAADPAGVVEAVRVQDAAAISGNSPFQKCCERRTKRSLGTVLVERCWLCLEQPAVTTIRAADGREFPACDVCAVEHPNGPDLANRAISDDDLRRIVGDLSA